MMDRARFDTIVAAYGADPRRWPSHERDAAQALAAREQVDLRDARVIDALLDASPSLAAPSDLLAARILRAAPKQPARLAPVWALAACAVFGVMLGYGAGLRAPLAVDVEPVLAAAFGAPGGDWPGEDI